MSYEGRYIGRIDGIDVQEYTPESYAHASSGLGGEARMRYCVVGRSHWNPASFFRQEARKLQRDAILMLGAAEIIEAREASGRGYPGAALEGKPCE